MNFRSILDMSVDIKKHLLPVLPRNIKAVYGVPRSGVLPASIIATALGVDVGMVGGPPLKGGNRRRILLNSSGDVDLLVDDTIYTGNSMAQAVRLFNKPCLTCAIYASTISIEKVNFYALELNGPRVFEWNFTGIKSTEEYIFDMDGVICEDPSVFDDDGVKYEMAIKNLKPLYLPQVKVKAICTNRINRWRSQTEQWLFNYGVKYDKLIMQPFSTAVERRRKSKAYEYKAYWYTKLGGSLFIESHDVQAKQIADISKKPVLSIESMRLF